MGLFSSLFGSKKSEYSEDFKQEVGQQALDLSASIHEAMEKSKASSDKEEKMLSFNVAVDHLVKLKDMADKYPFLGIGLRSLSEVEKEIREIADDTKGLVLKDSNKLKIDDEPADQDDKEDTFIMGDEALADMDEPPGEDQPGAEWKNDYLGMASYAETQALDAIENKNYDEA
jgi:hypothetical protein